MSDTVAEARQGALSAAVPGAEIQRIGNGATAAAAPSGPTPPKPDAMADLLSKFEKIASVLNVKEPGLVAGLNRLVEQGVEPGRSDQPLFRTQVAYMLQDVEKLVGAKTTSVPAELRAELTTLARSSPGLENRNMETLLRGTANIADRGLIRDIRRNAATIAGMGDQQSSPQVREMVEVLENRFRLAVRFTEPVAVSPGVGTSAPKPSGTVPDAAQPGTPKVRPEPELVRTARSPGDDLTTRIKAEPAPPPERANSVTTPGVMAPAVGRPKSLMSSIMGGLRVPNGPTPPWEPPPSTMKDRVAAFEQQIGDHQTNQNIALAEKSGQALMQSMDTFMKGPGGGVLGKIEAAASTEPGGMRAVMSEMQPGGRYASLRSEFDNALQQDRAFAASFNAVEKAAVQYGHDRLTLGADFQARKMDTSQLDARFDRADAAIAGAAEKIPGRSPGQSIMAEMAEKVSELLSRAADRVRQIFAREPEAGPRQGSSPGMAP